MLNCECRYSHICMSEDCELY